MMGSNITGRLLNAERRPIAGGGFYLVGEVYEDVRGRFFDGERIQTSPVVGEDGSVILTANSIYEVESWAQ